jgi:hypothetical protein
MRGFVQGMHPNGPETNETQKAQNDFAPQFAEFNTMTGDCPRGPGRVVRLIIWRQTLAVGELRRRSGHAANSGPMVHVPSRIRLRQAPGRTVQNENVCAPRPMYSYRLSGHSGSAFRALCLFMPSR